MILFRYLVFGINWLIVEFIGSTLQYLNIIIYVSLFFTIVLCLRIFLVEMTSKSYLGRGHRRVRVAINKTISRLFVKKSTISITIGVLFAFTFFAILIKRIDNSATVGGYIFDWETLLKEKTIYIIARGFYNTLMISVLSLLFSVVFGMVISIVKKSRILLLNFIANSYVELIIGTPLIVQVILFYYFLSPTLGLHSNLSVGIAILSIFYGAYVSEIFRAGIESVDKTQWESAVSLGFTKYQQYIYLIIPQVIRNILPPLAGQLALVVKGSALLSIVGIAEITKRYQELDSLEFAPAEFYTALAVSYLVMTIPISVISKHFEQTLKKKGT